MSSNDDMLVRKVEQQVKNENFPSASGCLLSSLDLISPIGKIKQREPGPITSTPRVFAAERRDHIFQSNCFDKLSHIHEAFYNLQRMFLITTRFDITNGDDKDSVENVVLFSDEKEPKLSSTNSISTSNEKNLHLIGGVDRSRSILSSAVVSPLELEKKKKSGRQITVAKNLYEKRKIIWGNTGQIVNKSKMKSPLTDDKEPASPMQVSTAEGTSNMNISKRNSANNEAELLKEKKTNSCNSSDIFSTSDDSKIKGVQKIFPSNVLTSAKYTASMETEVVSDNNCSSFLVEKENIPTLKKSSNEIEDITAPNRSSEDSIHISTTDSSIEILNDIERNVPVTTNKLVATSIHDVSDSPPHYTSTSEPTQKIPETLSRLELETQLQNLKNLKQSANLSKLPDCGRRLLEKIEMLEEKLINRDAFGRNANVAPNEPIEREEASSVQKKDEPPVISSQIITGGHRLFGGKMTDNRICLANAVTGQVIAQMHSSLANVPENLKTNTPTSLLTELMPHQKEGLTWLLWREKQSLPGGILDRHLISADDMGLGKTLSMISLIVNVKENRSCLIPSRTTLIIAPASLIFQWEAEFQKHVKSGFLSRYVFHGPKHKRDISAECLARYDVVVTTYGIVSNELSEKFTAVGVEDERSSSDESASHTENGKGKTKRKDAKMNLFASRLQISFKEQNLNKDKS
ncbi:unnamed protein product [Brugia timori]|uniref:Helicase ATP-binding domain-containing protein n=1 Tax=Brugia timori TaxID=42155 RepID=A0A0R3QU26_9BILA|nr:unnamed protein product [Brugia timori]